MIAGLILAAGESSRMGRDKALLPYRGRTFLETIIHTLGEAGITPLAVVLGHHANEIQKAADLAGASVVLNHEYQRGQTSSLQAGLRALMSAAAAVSPITGVRWTPSESKDRTPPPPVVEESGDEDNLSRLVGIAATAGGPDAVVLCLVDHPAVTSESIRKLVVSFLTSRASVVIPTYQGRRGHPVLIARALFPELLALGPDAGANTVIRKYRDQTRFVEVDDPGVLLDVDDPDTYGQLE